jgi:hypothetical protein
VGGTALSGAGADAAAAVPEAALSAAPGAIQAAASHALLGNSAVVVKDMPFLSPRAADVARHNGCFAPKQLVADAALGLSREARSVTLSPCGRGSPPEAAG